jgi:hypothetical protein
MVSRFEELVSLGYLRAAQRSAGFTPFQKFIVDRTEEILTANRILDAVGIAKYTELAESMVLEKNSRRCWIRLAARPK